MDRNLFNIEPVKTEIKGLLRLHEKIEFAVQYRGVEINRFPTADLAEDCVAESVSIRDDAQWAFEDALRRAGYEIPASTSE